MPGMSKAMPAVANRQPWALVWKPARIDTAPHRPIYEQALHIAEAARGRSPAPERVLAIGDSVRTDLKGAVAFGIDCLFITAGIHAEELGGRERPDAQTLADIFAAAGMFPKAVMRRLAW